MPKSTICGCFFFKASHAQELVEVKTAQLILVEVVKILQLTGQQFQNFSANLLRDMPFLIQIGRASCRERVLRLL